MILTPAGFTAAPLADSDIDDVVGLVRVCELHDSHEAMFERADLVADLASDGMDRGRDALVIRAGTGDDRGRVVAWAMVVHRRSRWADVHPDSRGLGIGSSLVDWSIQRGAAIGADRIGQTVADGRTDAVELFRRTGAQAVRTAWILRRDHDPSGPAPTLRAVPSVTLRACTPADEVEALELMELAFSQWPDRLPASLSTWQALVTRRAGFTAQDLQLAIADDGRVVGAAFLIDDGRELWVDKLATHPGFRGRGIGGALLDRAFAMSYSRARCATALSTDSNTGALPFYQRHGMRVTRSFTHWATPLGQAGPAS